MTIFGLIMEIKLVAEEYKNMVITWLWSGIILVVFMVVIGGITRLTDSGLSIVTWDVISGTLPPTSESQWQQTFEAYKQFPEYQKLNYGMSLSDFKSIFWWEYIHRLLGRITGIVFMVPFLYLLIRKSLSPLLIKKLLFILFLGMCQGAMGWIMVKSGLRDNPHVSHFRLTAHLSLALLIIGSILWVIMEIRLAKQDRSLSSPKAYNFAILCLLFLVTQIVLGAFVAGLKAGYSFNSFPLMNDQLLPSDVFGYAENILENGVFMQFLHRWFAWLLLVFIFILWFKIRKGAFTEQVRRYSALILTTSLLQVFAGIATLVLKVPVILGVIHQLLAVILFILMIALVFSLKYNQSLYPVKIRASFLK